MANDRSPGPRLYPGVMVSSTFQDLQEHRAALIKAIDGQDLKHIGMEDDAAKPNVDVIDSSMRMVHDASAYIGIIGHKYGQIPKCEHRNPDELSLTELEFNEAQRHERPALLFIMGEKHPVRRSDVETDPAKIKKLEAFRERAKQMKPGSAVHRVYVIFDDLESFTAKAIQSVANLRHYLDEAADNNRPMIRDQASMSAAAASQTPPSRTTSGDSQSVSSVYGAPSHAGIRITRSNRDTINLTVRIMSTGQSIQCEVPLDMTVEGIVVELGSRLQVPRIEVDGRKVEWDLYSKSLGRELESRKTIRENRVPDGDTLTFSRIISAG